MGHDACNTYKNRKVTFFLFLLIIIRYQFAKDYRCISSIKLIFFKKFEFKSVHKRHSTKITDNLDFFIIA